ncbi:MAG: hydrogenase maturation protease [Verrucomicrobiota bacterium]|nr:hydrogenase maturation protease [Verrucomicrobiota bacterium]
MKKILVAGIGNIFFGDDAFGCEVATQLARRPLPEGVRVTDFGIRSYDLAYAIMDDYDAVILVDATPQGAEPGTIYLIEPDIKKLDDLPEEAVNAHSMNPVRVLQLVRSLGGNARWLRVVGCEPAVLESEEGAMGLSEKVQAAVGPAIEMIEGLIQEISNGTEKAVAPIESRT